MNGFEMLIFGAIVVLLLCWIFPPFQLVVFFGVLICIICG